MLHADNCYHLPHVRIESHRLKTNTQSATAFRGFGGPQGMVGIERVMDHVAHALGPRPAGGAARRTSIAPTADRPPGALPPGPPEDISGQKKGAGVGRGRPDLARGERLAGGAHGCRADGRCRPRPTTCRSRISSGMSWWRSWSGPATIAARKAAIAEWNAASPILKRGIALTPVKFGISLHADLAEPGGGAGACLSGRLGRA